MEENKNELDSLLEDIRQRVSGTDSVPDEQFSIEEILAEEDAGTETEQTAHEPEDPASDTAEEEDLQEPAAPEKSESASQTEQENPDAVSAETEELPQEMTVPYTVPEDSGVQQTPEDPNQISFWDENGRELSSEELTSIAPLLPPEPEFTDEDEEEEDDTETVPEPDEDEEPGESVSKKLHRKVKRGWLIACAAVLLLGIAFILLYFNMYPVAACELGTGLPEAGSFMRNGQAASYIDPPEVSLTEPGTYLLKIQTGLGPRLAVLLVRDTEAPYAEDAKIVITVDDHISPRDAIKNVYDASDYMISWTQEPIVGVAGTYYCEVELTDIYNNTRLLPVTVTIQGVREVLECEAGSGRPYASDFVNCSFTVAEYVTDMDEIDWNTPGDYPVQISVDKVIYDTVLRIVDTTVPEFTLLSPMAEVGTELTEETLVESVSDATALTWTITGADTSAAGDINVTVTATDLGGNSTTVETTVTVCDKVVAIEASQEPVTRLALLEQLGYSIYSGKETETTVTETDENGETVNRTVTEKEKLEDCDIFVPNHIGRETAKVDTARGTIVVGFEITDTSAPTADSVPQTGFTGYKLEPEDFIENLNDGTSATVNFLETPDWEQTGTQTVKLRLLDSVGNEAVITSQLTLEKDTEAPVLYGTLERTVYVGDTIDYLENITAVDNADDDVSISIDKSRVNETKAGIYPVTYTAQDRDGNSITVTVNLTFLEPKVKDADLQKVTDAVLDKILTDGMTTAEQARAVFDYCKGELRLTETEENADTTDWKSAAYDTLSNGAGDDFGIWSAQYLLLRSIDWSTECRLMPVQRVGGVSEHYWTLVDLGTGWYHFDACPDSSAPAGFDCFMVTTDELEEQSGHYWAFDAESYPAVATEKFE